MARFASSVAVAALMAALPLATGNGGVAKAETLADALVTAIDTSPILATERARLRTLDERVEQERSGLRPNVSANASAGVDATSTRDGGSFSTDTRTPFSLTLQGTQSLYNGGQVSNAVKGARANVRAGRSGVRGSEQDVLLAAVSAYVNVLRSQENVAISRNNVEVIGRQLTAARDRFEVGEVTRTDVAQAQARLAQSQATLQTNLGNLGSARQDYREAVGVAPQSLSPLPPLPDLPDSMEEAFAIGERNHPDVAAARQSVEAASFGVKEAMGATLPSVDLQGDLGGRANSTSQGRSTLDAGVSVVASIPLYTGGNLESRVREAQALAAQRRAELGTTTRIVLADVGVAWETLKAARATIVANREEIRAARIAFEGVREEAKVGSRTTLDVLDAEQELLNARFNLVAAQSDEYTAGYQLLSAIGLLTVDHLGLATQSYDPASVDRPSISGPLDTWPETEDTGWLERTQP